MFQTSQISYRLIYWRRLFLASVWGLYKMNGYPYLRCIHLQRSHCISHPSNYINTHTSALHQHTMNRISFLSLCALVLGTSASPAELINPSQQAAIQAKCRDISHTLLPDPACWNTLDMDGWLKEWNRPGVTTECKPGEAWANCFMRLTNPNIPDIDCTTMKSKTCPEPKPAEIVPGPAEIYYGAWSIWCTYN